MSEMATDTSPAAAAEVVMPGDNAATVLAGGSTQQSGGGTLRLGNGLWAAAASGRPGTTSGGGERAPPPIFATKTGVLHKAIDAKGQGDRYFVQNQQRRYVPTIDDSVLGVVVDKHGESYKVNIGGAAPATLAGIAFEGASRRNRPHLEVRRASVALRSPMRPHATRSHTTDRVG